jgi:hypothetical protein
VSRVPFLRVEYGCPSYVGCFILADHITSNVGTPSAPRGKSLEGPLRGSRLDKSLTGVETKMLLYCSIGSHTARVLLVITACHTSLFLFSLCILTQPSLACYTLNARFQHTILC